MHAVLIGHPAVKLRVVRVAPVLIRPFPRQLSAHLYGSGEFVKAYALKRRVVLQYEDRVRDIRAHRALLASREKRLPVFSDLLAPKIEHRPLFGVLREGELCLGILRGKGSHSLEARQLFAAALDALIQMPIAVYPDKVESIAELPADRVRRVI